MDEWVSLHWNAAWGIVIYVLRLLNDLCFVGGSSQQKIQKLKNIGPDLYWISVVLWGVILANLGSPKLFPYLGKTLHFRIVILIVVVVMGFIISKMKQKGEDFVGQAVQTRKQVFFLGVLYFATHMIGLGSILCSIYLIGKC